MTLRRFTLLLLLGCASCQPPSEPQSALPETLQLTPAQLQDKIKGGWAAQTIGVTFGGPTEFRYNGTMIQDYVPIPWYDGYLAETYANRPGLYDDIYMDLTFVEVLEREGLDAPASAFANAFANAEYRLWHANQIARYNVLRGLAPPESGHWLNNPEADAIDFQIEADFAGLMSPGMPNAAAGICDRVGHIMNYGDGYYGGVYVAAMYALAFVSDNPAVVVREALKAIPEQSTFHQTIRDVINWHAQYPDDWKRTWFEIERKWSSDIGSPGGVFMPFNIDAKLNAAYVVLGLLYGQGDFTKTLQIATRAGQDSDCNPASAAGILGTIKGYNGIPDYWKQGLAAVEPIDFQYTTTSLSKAYQLSYQHARRMIERHGGTAAGETITIPVQTPQPLPLEQSFAGHYPVERRVLDAEVARAFSFTFQGIGFAVNGAAVSRDSKDHVLTAEVQIDGERVETAELPTNFTKRKFIPFWKYQLPEGEHQVEIKIAKPSPQAYVRLDYLVVYGSAPLPAPY